MSEPVRVHLRVPGTAPMPELVRHVQSIEAGGFDGAGILDSQMISRDTFVVLGQAAANTSRLTLFPAVTNPFTRHASVLAGGIQTVEEIAPGRVKFVMGTGYTSASTIGRKPATLAEMRDCIKTVRALLAGDSVDFAGTPGRLGYAAKRRIPVIMAASGPKAIEVAGEVADGVLLLVGFNRGIVETALGYLERGVKRVGTAAGGSGDHVGGAHRHRGHHRRGAPACAPDRRALGHPALGRLLGGAGRAEDPEARDPGRGPSHLSRSLARSRLGGGHRGDVVRPRRGRGPAVRRLRPDRHAGGLRRAASPR